MHLTMASAARRICPTRWRARLLCPKTATDTPRRSRVRCTRGWAKHKPKLCTRQKAIFQQQNGALLLPQRGDQQTTLTFYNLTAAATTDRGLPPQFQHRQRLSAAPALGLTTAHSGHWGQPAPSPKRPPRFDRRQKVSPTPKPTKPSKIW